MTITELKAAAYDALANIEYWQKKLAEINQQIAEQMEKEKQNES